MILRLAKARPQRDSIPCMTPSAGHAGAGAPQLAISHKISLDFCLSNIGGRPGRLPLRLEIIDRTRATEAADASFATDQPSRARAERHWAAEIIALGRADRVR